MFKKYYLFVYFFNSIKNLKTETCIKDIQKDFVYKILSPSSSYSLNIITNKILILLLP